MHDSGLMDCGIRDDISVAGGRCASLAAGNLSAPTQAPPAGQWRGRSQGGTICSS